MMIDLWDDVLFWWLLVLIYDVLFVFVDLIEWLVEIVGGILGGLCFVMLVVFDYWGVVLFDCVFVFVCWFCVWVDVGVEMFLYGWFYCDISDYVGFVVVLKVCYMIVGEGEFLGLSVDEVEYWMCCGCEVVEYVIECLVVGFIVLVWFYGVGVKVVLKMCDFVLVEDYFWVWQFVIDKIVVCGLVVIWVS